MHAAAVAHTRGQTFYDVLKADPQHKLIMKAVDADPEGKMKQMLQDTAPVTAFVPIDKVRLAGHHQNLAAVAAAAAMVRQRAAVHGVWRHSLGIYCRVPQSSIL
jgi:hypothetical protein